MACWETLVQCTECRDATRFRKDIVWEQRKMYKDTEVEKHKPPSWTCGHGRLQRRSGSDHDVDHTLPSCSWRQTSAGSAPGHWEHGTAGCHEMSAEQSRAWRSADVGTEPCWRPVYADQRSAVTLNSMLQKQWPHLYRTLSTFNKSIISYHHMFIT